MTIFVTGATGTQGNAVVQALLAKGIAPRTLVRDPASPAARALAAKGAQVVQGSLDDEGTLRRAMEGVVSLFSMQPAPSADADSERRQVRSLVAAALAEGVRHVVHSSVSNTGHFTEMAGWNEGRWERNYWESKRDAEDAVRKAGFATHVILRPAFMMDNFATPKAHWMFPDLADGALLTAVRPETKLVLIAADDVGRVAAEAIENPSRFDGEILELAGDLLTLPEIAAVLSRVKARPVTARTMEARQLIERGQHAGWVETQQWMNLVNYPARPAMMEALGMAPVRFADWAVRHADRICIGEAA